jgi:DNA-binding SARP family transcriptional activator
MPLLSRFLSWRSGRWARVEVESARSGPVVLAGAKVRGIVALLVLEAGRPVASERLIDALWEEAGGSGTNALQVAVSKLRRAFAQAGERDRLVTRSAGYQLEVDRGAVDALRFEQFVGTAAGREPVTAESLRAARVCARSGVG